jgi:hypothetical protein
MKVLTTVTETDNEGFLSLLGQRITLFCANHIITGDLTGVNDVQVKLDNPAVVYETGAYTDKKWKDAQSLPNSVYVRLSAVEFYGIIK